MQKLWERREDDKTYSRRMRNNEKQGTGMETTTKR